MKISRWVLVLIFLSLSSSVALADGIDPGVKLQGGNDATGVFTANDPNFSFTAFASEFGTVGAQQEFDFINFTNQVATEVDLVVTLLPGTPALTFTCDGTSDYFSECSVTDLGGGQTEISYFAPNTGPGGFGGLPPAMDFGEGSCDGPQSCFTDTPGADFGVVVTDSNGDLHNLPGDEGFSAQGSLVLAVPEPPTVFFFIAAGTLLFLLKRRYVKIPALGFSR